MIERLGVEEAARRLAQQGTVLLDVREPHEVDFCSIPGAIQIPLREVRDRALEELNPKDSLLIYCHHGGRSLMAAQLLDRMGFELIANMEGGIDAWSVEIDTSIPRY